MTNRPNYKMNFSNIYGSNSNYKKEEEKKEGQKVLVATYTAEMIFKIPKDIDVEDKNVVENVYVKHGTMYIEFKDKSKPDMEIYSCFESEVDYKYPTNIKVELAEDVGVGESDDEE